MWLCVCVLFCRAIEPEDLSSMGFSVEPKVSLMGATTADALAANPTLTGLDECARLVHKPLRSFISVRRTRTPKR